MLVHVVLVAALLCLDIASVFASTHPKSSSLPGSLKKRSKKKVGKQPKTSGAATEKDKQSKPVESEPPPETPRSSLVRSSERYKKLREAQARKDSLSASSKRLLLSLESFQKRQPAAQEPYTSPGGKLTSVKDFLELHAKSDMRIKSQLEGMQQSYEFLASLDCAVSQLAGRVQSILVKPGDMVTLGTPLAVIESMKMEITIKALKDNVVVDALKCAKGDTVSNDTVILTYKADDSA